MDLLVVGGGGREHAIIKKLKENPVVETIYALPGNGGIAADAGAFTFAAFISGALLNAIPGIVVQLILVPAVVVALQKAKLIEAPSAEKA